MTGKHRNWHRAWSRLPNGRLRHISGAEFVVERGEGFHGAGSGRVGMGVR